MRRVAWFLGVTVWMSASCVRPGPEQQLILDAATALGGADRLRAVRSIVIEGEGTQYNLGQDVIPGASGQTFSVTQYRRAVDLTGQRARTELTRTPNFAYFLGLSPQRQVQGIDGDVGYNVAANGTATRVADAGAADRRAELLRHPLAAVRAALEPEARLTNLRSDGGQSSVDVATTDGRTFTLSVDSTTHLPSRVTTLANHVNLGDVRISTTFADYQLVSGVQLPARLITRTDDFVTIDVRVKSQTIDGDTGDLAAPEAASKPLALAGAPTVAVEEMSKGIWHLTGGSHHSALVEFADHLLLIEAPQNDARTLAVIAKAREVRPGKPLTHVVNTHHHFDHSGGVRAAISEGLTLITHQGNAAFFEEIAKRPHTLAPDALSKNSRPLKMETVSEEKTISDGTMTVTLYPLSGVHTNTMLMAYVPRDRMLIEADVYEPGEPVHMFAAGLLESIRQRKLAVDRILPLHMKPVPFAELVKDAASPAK